MMKQQTKTSKSILLAIVLAIVTFIGGIFAFVFGNKAEPTVANAETAPAGVETYSVSVKDMRTFKILSRDLPSEGATSVTFQMTINEKTSTTSPWSYAGAYNGAGSTSQFYQTTAYISGSSAAFGSGLTDYGFSRWLSGYAFNAGTVHTYVFDFTNNQYTVTITDKDGKNVSPSSVYLDSAKTQAYTLPSTKERTFTAPLTQYYGLSVSSARGTDSDNYSFECSVQCWDSTGKDLRVKYNDAICNIASVESAMKKPEGATVTQKELSFSSAATTHLVATEKPSADATYVAYRLTSTGTFANNATGIKSHLWVAAWNGINYTDCQNFVGDVYGGDFGLAYSFPYFTTEGCSLEIVFDFTNGRYITTVKNAEGAISSPASQQINSFPYVKSRDYSVYGGAAAQYYGLTVKDRANGADYSGTVLVECWDSTGKDLLPENRTRTSWGEEYYFENAEGEYELGVGLTGLTNNVLSYEKVSATLKDGAGYVYNAEHPDTVATAVVAGDGSTTLKTYYKLASYDITYSVAGEETTESATYLKPVTKTVEKEGYVFIGWDIDGTLYKNTFTYNWTEAKTATAVLIDFVTYDGASVKTLGTQGMRFLSEIKAESKSALAAYANVTVAYGTKVGVSDTNTQDVPAKNWYNDEATQYTAVLTGFTEAEYTTVYTAIAYVDVTFGENDVVRYYARCVDKDTGVEVEDGYTARSIAQVAALVMEDCKTEKDEANGYVTEYEGKWYEYSLDELKYLAPIAAKYEA
ncbi:MAG: hypothetical protein IJX88_05040 [Clostridia bacterium]|nr:hypothetical protein [Clostridia bacterium]